MKAKRIIKIIAAAIVAFCSGIGLGIIGGRVTGWITEDLVAWVDS